MPKMFSEVAALFAHRCRMLAGPNVPKEMEPRPRRHVGATAAPLRAGNQTIAERRRQLGEFAGPFQAPRAACGAAAARHSHILRA